MLAPPTISMPNDPLARTDLHTPQELSAPLRFPHTRAQLTAIARQYRPLDNFDDDNDDEEAGPSTAGAEKDSRPRRKRTRRS